MFVLEDVPDAPFKSFLSLNQAQLESSDVPAIFWNTLFNKLTYEIFDAGEVFQLALYENPEDESKRFIKRLIVCREEGIQATNGQHIFLVDHAWTYEANQAKKHLTQLPQLLKRMCDLMNYPDNDTNDNDHEKRIEFVLREMWKYNNTFSFNVGNVEDRLPLWYIMDEVGCAISHSDSPNFRMVPFVHLPEGTYYSIIFPIKDLTCGEEVSRDFVEGLGADPEIRKALLLPWMPNNFKDINLEDSKFNQVEPDKTYFLTGQIKESWPDLVHRKSDLKSLSSKAKVKVFSNYSYVTKYLTDSKFEITEDQTQADILWLMTHFKDYKELYLQNPEVFINQFPCEHVITVKNLLPVICRRKAGTSLCDPRSLKTFPIWMPTTYDLNNEMLKFIVYFKRREAKYLDNIWICKPWNLARGLDICITDNILHILRLPCTGPKIVQKYISRPVLYKRPEIGDVKFDIRYMILLQSVDPLRAGVYGNFFLRFANKPFALTNFYDYEQHFTVMNYDDEVELCHVKCEHFVTEWDKQYPEFAWKSCIEPKILKMIKEILEAAVCLPPPKGIAANPQSRAMYAMDLMLQWGESDSELDIHPVVLEVNFSPDCKRACEYYPNFFNDVFKYLFLGDIDSTIMHNLFFD